MIISLIFSVFIAVGGFLTIRDAKIRNKNVSKTIDDVEITVIGAVRFHGPFEMKFGSTVKMVLMKAELLYGAELKGVELDKKLYKKETLLIPFKEGYGKKIKINDLTLLDLIRAGIRKKTSALIMKFIKTSKGKGVTWDDLDSIRGVGSTTLNLLKKILELN
ncbi:hypothetical protein C4B25_02560 [Mycoplasma todarodis]|uniref:Uncharacterized protein n=2 Tax=Mycoplasma todarodis TaxID=1937191 RepID=A0A4R0XRH0_9MOLU|nr:hypothetical protein C4B25_02560 [Mycoplasma todarodis]